MRKLDAIKAQQLTDAEQNGVNPYAVRDTGESGATPIPAAPQTLEHYQAAMSADLARLSPIKDIVERAKLKVSILETYWPFVADYVKNGEHYANDIAVRVCIWLFDILDIERGLELAFVLIKQNQVTPPKFDRDLPTFVCDAVYDWANAMLKEDQSASPYLDVLIATLEKEQWSLAPPVQSKLYVMLAKHKKRLGDWVSCVALCERAEQVNPEGAGVKTLKQEAQSKLKPLAPE